MLPHVHQMQTICNIHKYHQLAMLPTFTISTMFVMFTTIASWWLVMLPHIQIQLSQHAVCIDATGEMVKVLGANLRLSIFVPGGSFG